MKNYFRLVGLLAVCAAGFTSCQKEAFPEPFQEETGLTEDPGSRTSYSKSSSDHIHWEENDQLNVVQIKFTSARRYVADTKISTTPLLNGDTYSVFVPFNQTTGKYEYPESFADKTAATWRQGVRFMYQAFYPNYSRDGANVRITLPGTQTPTADSFDRQADLIVSGQVYSKTQRAKPSALNCLEFKRVSSFGVINMTGLGAMVRSVTVEAPAGVPLHGKYQVNIFTHNNSYYTSGTAGNNVLTLKPAFTPADPDNYKVCFSCLPTAATTIKVTVKTTDGKTYVSTFDNVAFRQGRGTVLDFKAKTKTLMTYNVAAFKQYENIRSGRTTEAAQREIFSDIAGVINEQAPQYVALNEVDKNNSRRTRQTDKNYVFHSYIHTVDQMNTLAGYLDSPSSWTLLFGETLIYSGGEEGYMGNGVLFKTDEGMIGQTNYLFTSYPSTRRSMLIVETEDCVFVSAHIGVSDAERVAQAAEMNEYFDRYYKDYDKPVFVCGDFNAAPAGYYGADGVYNHSVHDLMGSGWTILSNDDDKVVTHNGSNAYTSKCFDYIFLYHNRFYSDNKALVDSKAFVLEQEVLNRYGYSDHYPVLVKVQWF